MPASRPFPKLLTLITLTVLLLNLLAPVGLTYAQDGSPPADPPPTEGAEAEAAAAEADPEEQAVGEEDAVVQEEAPAGEGQPTGEASPEDEAEAESTGRDAAGAAEVNAEQAEESQEAVSAPEAPGSEDSAEKSSADTQEEAGDAAASPEDAVADAVQALDEADAVLLDENGAPLSMASEAAAAVLAAPDPNFCPAGGGTCTGPQATIAAAIADWQLLGRPSGTFFIEGGSFAGVAFTETIAGVDLVFQGGAGGGVTTINTPFSVSNSDFSSITFNNITFGTGFTAVTNTGDLSFNAVIANNAGGAGIDVADHDGAVSLDNVTASGTGGDGLSIIQVGANTNTVTVTNSTFNGNTDEGMQITTTGAITVDDVNANNNQGIAGAALANINLTSDAPVSISDSSFNNNANGEGLLLGADGAVTLTNITATGNGDDGAEVHNFLALVDAPVTVTGGTYSSNGGDGLEIASDGQITLSNVNANLNTGGTGNAGLDLNNAGSGSGAGITLTTVTAQQNSNDGIKATSGGVIALTNVNANHNDDDGAEVHNFVSDAAVNVFNSNFNGNGLTAGEGNGLEILSYGTVTLDIVSASNNTTAGSDAYGAYIDNAGFGNNAQVIITNSVFNENQGVDFVTGLEVISDGTVTLDIVSASNNTTAGSDAYGAYIDNAGFGNNAEVIITNSVFNENQGLDAVTGLEVFSDGAITLNKVQANMNGATDPGGVGLGAQLAANPFGSSATSVNIQNSAFNGNFAGDVSVGLAVYASGSITLTNVAANNNTSTNGSAGGAFLTNAVGIAASIDFDAPINVSNSSFNNNGSPIAGYGLFIISQGSINLWGVSASGNTGNGVFLVVADGPHDTSIICSAMQNNGDTGISVDGDGGDLSIKSTNTSGNGVSPLTTVNVANTLFGTANCNPNQGGGDDGDKRDGKHEPLDPDDPTPIVLDLYPHSVTFPPMNLLECEGYVKSLFFPSELPGELNAGDTFLRALTMRIEGCAVPEDGLFTIGFAIPATEQGHAFAVLFWDGTTESWVEIPGQMTEDGRYTVTWPTTGTFVLVTR